ncbi:MAG TPA: MogA/MoaB family molybdenum cofactor biosynthesis protein [Thermoanaerobaculia bacterium]|nr:MogA/MoaB family molybdenum cofactor biosynthesis protein [Thermoanaerobaculia bacterium]
MSVVEEHRAYSPSSLGFAVVTVSDSRTEATDTGGARIRDLAVAAGHRVAHSEIVPDEVDEILGGLDRALTHDGVDVVVLTGGTGFSPRDHTVEAVAPRFEAEVPGFGELFRMLSHREIGAAAMLSRATAGLVDRRVVFLLPGSPKAVELAMRELILPEAGHLLGQIRRAPTCS